MKVSELSTSRYLKQDDVDGEVDVTVVSVVKENVAVAGEAAKIRGVIKFLEFEKGMVLNSTNRTRLEKAYGPETDLWIGKRCVLFVDSEVMFAGEVTGGLRVRVPRSAMQAIEEMESDVPQ